MNDILTYNREIDIRFVLDLRSLIKFLRRFDLFRKLREFEMDDNNMKHIYLLCNELLVCYSLLKFREILLFGCLRIIVGFPRLLKFFQLLVV